MKHFERVLGIKGFDKDLKCRDMQYKVGEIYSMDDIPKLCKKGFHYCKTISDAKSYYGMKEARFCVVEALGEIDEGVDKSCTNKLQVIREVKIDNNNQPFEPYLLQELNSWGFIIGGSLALRVHGYKIDRPLKEVDLITTKDMYNLHKGNIFKGYRKINRNSGMDSIACHIGLFGEKYDILIQNAMPSSIVREYKGHEIRVQDDKVIWEYKLEYALKGSIKHMNDITHNGIRFFYKHKPPVPASGSIDDQLPF